MEDRYLTTGSAIERAIQCNASLALPHANHTSAPSTRGVALHAFLEDVNAVGRDEALNLVDEEYRDVCEGLNLEGLDLQLSLTAEIAIAYDVETDTARELGRGEGRKYDDVKPSEIPCTLDVVGVREVAKGRRALVIDWKSGYTTGRAIEQVLQLDFGALAVARLFGCEQVEVQLVHVREHARPWIQRRTMTGLEIDAFAGEVRDMYRAALKIRETIRGGGVIDSWRTGPWCSYCPSWSWCPAQVNLARALLNGDEFADVLRTSPIPESAFGWLWDRLDQAEATIKRLRGVIRGAAVARPIMLGKLPTGEERWLGMLLTEGKDKLDGDKAFDVLVEQRGEKVARAAVKRVATKKDVQAALKAAVQKGKAAGAMREFLDALDARDGISNKVGHEVKEWTATPTIATEDPKQLPQG